MKTKRVPGRAFTRVELAAILAMVGLLLGWGSLWLRVVWRQSGRAACAHNLQTLGQAFLQCAQDQERLPRSAPLRRPETNDWIFWQPDRLLLDSAIAPFHPDFSARRLLCPKDAEAGTRDYFYSYTMNEHLSQRRLLREGPMGIVLLVEEANPNDGSWAPGNRADRLTTRHHDAAQVIFGDGHLQVLPPHEEPRLPR